MINQTINNYLAQHELVLQQRLNNATIPAQRLREAMHYALFPGGKRLRPVLVYLVGEVVSASPHCLDSIAAAIELTHGYSLIHDDLPAMDNDDFRRGKPSCHKAFDEATAILAGDGMQAFAIEMLLQELPLYLSYEKVIQIIQELLHASGPGGMVSGQCLDLYDLANANIKEKQLATIHHLKTGKLILACIKMVLASVNASKETAYALEQFAGYLGLAYQMQDDYLDAYGDKNILGKGRASDSANKKHTFANLYHEQELASLIDTYFHQAKNALTPIEKGINNLLALTEFIQQRGKD